MGNQESQPVHSFLSYVNVVPDIPDMRDKWYQSTPSQDSEEEACGSQRQQSSRTRSTQDLPTSDHHHDLIDLRSHLDVAPMYQMGGLGCSIASSVSSIIYNTAILQQQSQSQQGHTSFRDVPPLPLLPSRLYLHHFTLVVQNHLRSQDSSTSLPDTMSIRNALKALQRFGVCHEKEYTFRPETLQQPPSEQVCQQAMGVGGVTYLRVPMEYNAFRSALQESHMIIINFSVYSSFCQANVQRTGRISLPEPCDSCLGMMCGVVVGVWHQQKLFIVRLHLGDLWGDHGYGYLSWDFMEQLCCDAWILQVRLDSSVHSVQHNGTHTFSTPSHPSSTIQWQTTSSTHNTISPHGSHRNRVRRTSIL